ncbi:DUF6777 domain-containing protein [Streptomyces sp. NPDC001663]|uniref:DUF6777 domain-containing protein n=1 Tax=Streptomyces sp. NPDC001663 TaxID=3364597 RepID=UPI0036C2FBDA
MRTVTGTFATVCALTAALLIAACGGSGDKDTKASGEVFLQPVAAQGPDPFTVSTDTTMTATPSPVTPARPTPNGSARSVSGATPGLYGGTERVGSCDVDGQIRHLTSDQAKARAFAQVEGVSPASIPDYLRGLAPVVLRADTRVTNHGYRDGRATGFQSVLQAGTAVLVDNRGVPRVRCACGNPLKPATATQGNQASNGRPWSGYRPAQVVVVTPAPQVIVNITIVDIVHNTWIERHVGHDVHHDHKVPPPARVTPTPSHTPTPSRTPPPSRPPSPSPDAGKSTASPHTSTSPGESSASPSDTSSSPSGSATDCATETVTVTPGATDDVTTEAPSASPTDCPTATVTSTPPTTAPHSSGPIPDDSGRSIFDSPTNVFDS